MKIKNMLLTILFSGLVQAGPYHPAIDYIFPLPDSELLPVKTTVILKLDESYNDRITDLPHLITVKIGNVSKSGSVFWATDNRTIIFKPNSPFSSGQNVQVTVQLSQIGFDDFQYNFVTAKSSGNDLDWLNKTNGTASTPIREVQKMSPARLMNGVAVPSDFPEIQVNILGETAPGRIFIPADKWIIICDNDGTPYFYRKYEDGHEKMRFEAHPNGVLSFHSYEVYDIILDHNFVEIDTVFPGHGYLLDDHELQILENGHMLLVARDDVHIDMSRIVSGGNSNALVEAHHVQELDQEHNVIFEWRNWDHLDIRDSKVSLRGGFVDFVHTNSIAVDYDGHLVISPREYNMIMKIDRITGETIWILGGKNSDFEFINEDIEFSRIHDVRPVPGKPNQYTLFDNGRDRTDGPQFSRAVEYKLNLDAMTAEKVWEYRHNPDLFSSYCGSCQPFENGNRLIGWANHDTFTEVNSSGELVYEMHVSGFSCSRVRRCEWEGMMLHPYLILENMGPVIRLIFNKFGDPDVDYYNIYAGVNAQSLSLFETTEQTYYDIDVNLLGDGAQYFFRVTAVNNNGEESDFSQLESARIRVVAPGENAVYNGDFQSTLGWSLQASGGAMAAGQINNDGLYQINISQSGTDIQQVELEQDNVIVMQGKNYMFSFDAYASSSRAIGAKVESTNSSPINYGRIGDTGLTTRLRHYEFEFFMQYPTDPEAHVAFYCGGNEGDVFIDNVSLTYSETGSDLAALSAPWQSQDVGTPAVAGVAGMRGNRFVIRASGNDIWYDGDAFHFIYRQIQGDVELIARVISLEETNSWAKAGVEMRNSLSSESRHAIMIMSAGNGAAFQRRVQDGGSSTHTAGRNFRAPHWVRLVRTGNIFTGYESTDGSDWHIVDSENISMNASIFIGLAVTAHNDGAVCEAQFDQVQIIPESDVTASDDQIPEEFSLRPVYPNPLNPMTTIQFQMPFETRISICVYDVNGRKINTLIDGLISPGAHHVVWNGVNDRMERVASGLYFIRMKAEGFDSTQKVTVLK